MAADLECYHARRASLKDVTEHGCGAVTHMTAPGMCAFARDLVEAAHRVGAAAAVKVSDFGLGVVCAGWSKAEVKKCDRHGLALFQRLTPQLFREHFEIEQTPQLRSLQEKAWKALDARTRREFVLCSLAAMDARVKSMYNETHPAFMRFLDKHRAAADRRRRRSTKGEGGVEGSSSSV
jgi:hypothetical protein